MKARTCWLTVEERELIAETALELLDHVGMRMPGTSGLDTIAAAGGRVDSETGVVRFPPDMVRQALANCPREVILGGGTSDRDVTLRDGEVHFTPGGCAAHTLDYHTGAYRPSTHEDLRQATIIYDETPELDVMWSVVTSNDVPLEQRELTEYHTVLNETSKPIIFVDCPKSVDAVRAICEALAGDLQRFRACPRISTLCTISSPFQVAGELLDVHAALAAIGSPVVVYSMSIAGATSPVTLAGTMALGLAEVLGVVTALQVLSPGARLIMAVGPGILDMRTTTFSLASVESALMNAACVEIAHHLGLPAQSPALATDAKHLGAQNGYEKALKGLTVASAGADLMSGGMGLLDNSNALYLPQIVVDAEIASMIRRLLAETEVSSETLMSECIERIGIGGNFLGEKETRRRIRAGEHFMPRIASRLPYEQWVAEGRTELDVAIERVESILAARSQRESYLSDDQQEELASICGVAVGRAN